MSDAATHATNEPEPALDAFFGRRDEIVHMLRALGDVAAAVGAKSLRGRIATDLVQKLEEDRFHLVVVGEFNHGKTTFVNALLGESVLPVGVTPTTAAIHHIRWAYRPEAVLVTTSGEKRPIPIGDVRRFAVGGDSHAADVDHLEIGFPAPLLEARLLLVDTPGVNDLSLQRADITYDYIPRADAVLFLLDAGQILKESERVFLNEKLLCASRDKIFFIITKWDLLSPDEQREALEYAKSRLSTLVKEPVVFPVSAEMALAGKRAESGLAEIISHLTLFLAAERGRLQLTNAAGEGLAIAELLSKGIDARRRSLRMQGDELARRIVALDADLAEHASTIEQRRGRIREEIAVIKTTARKDLERFVDDVCRQLPDVIDSAKAADLKQYLPGFLESAYRRWIEEETREVATELEQVAERTIALVRDDARENAGRVAEMLGSDTRRLEVEVDTIKYDIGVVALMFGGVALMAVNLMAGGLLAVAGPAVFAMVARGKIHEEQRRVAKELAPQAARETAKRVGPKLDAMIDEFARRLDGWVVNAGDELHREVAEVLRATQAMRDGGQGDFETEAAEVERQAEALAQVTATLQAARERLAEDGDASQVDRGGQ
ncbi:MAG: dynamin family protein [Polyangiaceae bacterium]|jgi:predicted GTPase